MANNIKMASSILKLAAGGLFAASVLKNSIFSIEAGNVGMKFNKIYGLSSKLLREGWHLRIPYLEDPIRYDVQTHAKSISCLTGSRDLQMVKITVRVLYRPDKDNLQALHRYLGPDYDERVLPSVINEVLQSIVAQYNASQLITQREQISYLIQKTLDERIRTFFIILDNVSIVNLSFSDEFIHAIEAKQVAQQVAERAKYTVEQAIQDKKSTIIKAQAQATSAELIGKAMSNNPAFIELRRIDTAREIADIIVKSRNKIVLQSDTLLLDLRDSISIDGGHKRDSDNNSNIHINRN